MSDCLPVEKVLAVRVPLVVLASTVLTIRFTDYMKMYSCVRDSDITLT